MQRAGKVAEYIHRNTTLKSKMNQKEMTAHIRKRLKSAGIKAKCKMQDGGVITIVCPSYAQTFTNEQQREIKIIALANRLTFVRGSAIDLERNTDPMQFNFYISS